MITYQGIHTTQLAELRYMYHLQVVDAGFTRTQQGVGARPEAAKKQEIGRSRSAGSRATA